MATISVGMACAFPAEMLNSKVRFRIASTFIGRTNFHSSKNHQQSRRAISICAASSSSSVGGDDEDEVDMSPEEIKRAYEALYGPSWDRKKSGETAADEEEEEGPRRRGAPMGGRRGTSQDGFEESVVQVRRVTKVVKGGKQLQFRVVSVVGDKKGKVGVGVGKAKEVIAAVQKAVKDARRHLVDCKMTKYKTIPHRIDGHYHAADVMLRPASPGTGIIAGGSVRVVLELAGIENALGKQMGSDNCLNNARATVHAISQLRTFQEVAELRGLTVEELWR